ncbi:MAG: ActS/PrrB/RegB family redox-sensitive histidine kinase [Pseudomonadota bacterium]
MPSTLPQFINARGGPSRMVIRLDTLIRLRWYAIIGQLGAVVVVRFGLGHAMPWMACTVLILAAAALNLWLTSRYRRSDRMQADDIFALLAFDVAQLGALLYLTGGLNNPFAILLLAPVIVASTSLTREHTLWLGALASLTVTGIALFHLPLPWRDGEVLAMPPLFMVGAWVAFNCTLAFTGIYAYRVAQEVRKLGDALAATELVLQREQHLTALDGLAAAAAHELGTPLGTIAVVSKEMLKELPADSHLAEDAALLRSQAERCATILGKLTSLTSQGEPIMETHPLDAMMEEVVAPLRGLGAKISVSSRGEGAAPILTRSPGLHYGLGNLVENAVDFASTQVDLKIGWTADTIEVSIADDGPGFPGSVLRRGGEPFMSRRDSNPGRSEKSGMGLGLFIAKTLLERSGATVKLSNAPTGGALVQVLWARTSLEAGAANMSQDTANRNAAFDVRTKKQDTTFQDAPT